MFPACWQATEHDRRADILTDSPISVMLVDDHPIVLDGLRNVLDSSEEFEVVGQAKDGAEAVAMAAELSPDVVIMDVLMPNKDGVEACREIMESVPGTKVIMLTASTDEDAVIEAMAAGATGYLQKVTGKERLLATVKDVVAGELRVPTGVVMQTIRDLKDSSSTGRAPDTHSLTKRELEILKSFAAGASYASISEERGVKAGTIRNAIYVIQGKLRVTSKQELVIWAMRNGLLDEYELEQ